MQDILNRIVSEDFYKDDSKLIEITEQIIEYYKKNKGRHSYSDVSTFIYSSKEGDFEYLIDNLNFILEYLEREQQNLGYEKKIFKLIDHIQLELKREEHIKDSYNQNINEILGGEITHRISELNFKMENKNKETIEEINKNYELIHKKTTKLFNRQKQKIDNLNGSIISILGIFSAVIIAFFGGISILGSALNNMDKVSKYRLSFVVLLIGFITFNIIFMLLHSISKLSNKSIGSEFCEGKCSNCEYGKNKNNIRCINFKYPVAFYYNITSIILIIILALLFILDKYNIISKLILTFGIKKTLISIIPIILSILFIYGVFSKRVKFKELVFTIIKKIKNLFSKRNKHIKEESIRDIDIEEKSIEESITNDNTEDSMDVVAVDETSEDEDIKN